jgi:hypothetical protein
LSVTAGFFRSALDLVWAGAAVLPVAAALALWAFLALGTICWTVLRYVGVWV